MDTDDADLLEMADDEEKNSTCSETGYYKYIPTPIELFFKAKRPEFKSLYPNIGNRDRRKKMRLAWKNTSGEEKEYYIAERNRLKEEAYGSETTTTYGNSTIPINIFCRLRRPEFQQLFPDLDNNCIVGKMRQVWRKMSDNERKCFMEEYGKTEVEETANEEKVTMKIPSLQVGRSKKRNEELTAGFFIFVEEHRQKNLKNFNKLRSLKIGYELKQQWGEMVPSDDQTVTFAKISKLMWPMRTRNDQSDIRTDEPCENIQSLLTKEKYVEISQACEEKAAKTYMMKAEKSWKRMPNVRKEQYVEKVLLKKNEEGYADWFESMNRVARLDPEPYYSEKPESSPDGSQLAMDIDSSVFAPLPQSTLMTPSDVEYPSHLGTDPSLYSAWLDSNPMSPQVGMPQNLDQSSPNIQSNYFTPESSLDRFSDPLSVDCPESFLYSHPYFPLPHLSPSSDPISVNYPGISSSTVTPDDNDLEGFEMTRSFFPDLQSQF